MSRTHAHLVQHQFKKQTPGDPAPRTGIAPKKAVETPMSRSAPAILPTSTSRRQAAIEILTAGRVATKAPSFTKHEIRVAPTATALRR